MDLRDLGGHHQARHMNSSSGVTSLLADDASWVGRIAQTAIGVGRLRRLLAEFIDEGVVLAGEQVVERSLCRWTSCRGTPPTPGPSIAADRVARLRTPAGSPGRAALQPVPAASSRDLRIALHAFAAKSRRSRRAGRRPTTLCCCWRKSWARGSDKSLPSPVNFSGRRIRST